MQEALKLHADIATIKTRTKRTAEQERPERDHPRIENQNQSKKAKKHKITLSK